jgi:hypothetical protein
LGPGDTQKSYLTSLVKTNVEIDNVQLMEGTEQQILGSGTGLLLVAITDVDLHRNSSAVEGSIHLERGRVIWLPEVTTATYKNLGRSAARFVLLQIK